MPTSNELKFIQEIHGKLLNYLEKSKDRFVHPSNKAENLLKEFDLDINAPSSLSEMESHIDQYLESSVNTTSTRFYNQLFSGFSSMGYLGSPRVVDLRKKPKFVKITKAGFYESMVHNVDIVKDENRY